MTSASIVPRASNTANGVRDQAGREASPRAIIDSQSAKGAQKGVLARSFGLEAGKKIKVRKRHILVDTMGLLFSVVVRTADVQDHDGAFQCCVARDECFHSSNASSELQLTSVLPPREDGERTIDPQPPAQPRNQQHREGDRRVSVLDDVRHGLNIFHARLDRKRGMRMPFAQIVEQLTIMPSAVTRRLARIKPQGRRCG
jgi:hypothetical protein